MRKSLSEMPSLICTYETLNQKTNKTLAIYSSNKYSIYNERKRLGEDWKTYQLLPSVASHVTNALAQGHMVSAEGPWGTDSQVRPVN